ncbi:conserved exported protein of unknown function [Tenacibaculum sp. 190524A02b]|uniref:DUF6268 domain-containing protein n=1 Tax=Tenacibaculum vairaonense TaxID=3137860 RepID=A0ABM9PJ16_9FLAO
MVRKKIGILFMLLLGKAYGQVTGDVFVSDRDRDMFYAHYTPEINNNQLYDYQRVSTKFSFPLLRSQKFGVFNTIGMDYHSLSYNSFKPSFLNSKASYYNVNYSVLAQYRIAENWSINALIMPHVIGDFNRELTDNDLKINGILFAEKRFKSKNQQNYYVLSFGIGYLTLSGETMVNPVLNFSGNLRNKITFAVGLPSTYIKYNFNKKHAVKLLGELNDFTVNIDKLVQKRNGSGLRVTKNIFTTALVGVEYNYWLTKSIGILFRGTHSIFEKHEFQNDEDEVIYGFDTSLKSYISVGLRINPFRR